MAHSDSDSSEFLGFTAEDLDFSDVDYDSDISFSNSTDLDSDDDIPLGELRGRFSSENGKLADTVSRQVTDAPRPNTTTWGKTLTPIEVRDFAEETGPVFAMGNEKRELDFFNLLFPHSLFELLVNQTNLYARQCISSKPDDKWSPTNVDEMKAFFGFHIFMSIVQLPSYTNYWTTDPVFQVPSVRTVMTRTRFEKILQYFHANNNESNPGKGEQGYDKLHHVRPVFDLVQEKLVSSYNPHKTVSIDEAMIPFRGRLSYKQYLPAKPCKFGIKVWELADATNGYVYQMQVYTGKTAGGSETGLSTRVVLDLTRILAGKNFHVYMDNFFSSPDLFDRLLTENIYAAGTCRVNRKRWPDGLHAKCLPKERGSSKMYQNGNLVATSWFDKRQVNFLSTNADPTVIVQMKRKQKDGFSVPVPAPEVVFMYNENMSGVDHGDQLRMQYSTARRSKKYWKYIFWFLFDTALSSAYILMKESPNHQVTSRSGKQKVRSQLEFRQNLAKQLIGVFRQKRRYEVSPHDQTGRSHWPCAMPTTKRCVQCRFAKVRKESKFGCRICGVNLCVCCFEAYHSRAMEE